MISRSKKKTREFLYRTIKHKLLSTEEVFVRMQRRWTDIKRPPYKLEKASASLVDPLGVSWKTHLYRCLYNTPALQHQKFLLFPNSVLYFLEDFLNISSCICNFCFKPQRCSTRTFTSRVYFSFKRHSVSCLMQQRERELGLQLYHVQFYTLIWICLGFLFHTFCCILIPLVLQHLSTSEAP